MVRYLFYSVIFFQYCFYDATPPSESEKQNFRGELVVYISQLANREKVLFFYRMLNSPTWVKGPQNLWATSQGEIYFSYLFEANYKEIEILLVCDQNQNGEQEPSEPAFTSAPISFTLDKPIYYLKLNRGDFSP